MSYKRLLLVLAVLGYCLLLNLDYRLVESPVNELSGVTLHAPPVQYVALGYLLAALSALWMPIGIHHPSQVGYWWLYLLLIVPSLFVPYHVLNLPPEQIAPLPCVLTALFCLQGISYAVPSYRIARPRLNKRLFFGALSIAFLVAILVLALGHGFDFTLNLNELYDRRFLARETLPSGTPLSYTASLFQRCLTPLMFIVGLAGQIPLALAFGLVGSLLSFLLTAEKTLALLPVYLLAIAYALRRFRNTYAFVVLLGATILISTSMFEYLQLGSRYLSTYASRRLFVVPAQATSLYWEYYTTHEPDYFSSGLIGRMMGKERRLSPAQTIGAQYFGTSENNANASIWGSAYADMRYGGMFLVTIIAAIVFRFIDAMGTGGRFFVASLLSGLVAEIWAEGSMQTSLLSAGVLPLLLALYLAPPYQSGGPRHGRKTFAAPRADRSHAT